MLGDGQIAANFVKYRLTIPLMVKECTLNTGNMPRRGLPSVDRITDRPDITSAVDRARKA